MSWKKAKDYCENKEMELLMEEISPCKRGPERGGEWIGLIRKQMFKSVLKKTGNNLNINNYIFFIYQNNFVLLLSGVRYMNPVSSNIIYYCSEIIYTESCGLLVRNMGFEVKCRFVPCSEKHFYTCTKLLRTGKKTKGL